MRQPHIAAGFTLVEILMSLVIFLPSFFGLLLLFCSSKYTEALRWIATLGSALTLTTLRRRRSHH